MGQCATGKNPTNKEKTLLHEQNSPLKTCVSAPYKIKVWLNTSILLVGNATAVASTAQRRNWPVM